MMTTLYHVDETNTKRLLARETTVISNDTVTS
jgi:hypothetical protein